jgi:uncharacterized protein (DUF433 family)
MIQLTTAEVVALFGLSESQIRKDVEHGLFQAPKVSSPPRFDLPHVAYFKAVAAMGLSLSVEDRRSLFAVIADALAKGEVPRRVPWREVVDLKLADIVRDVSARLRAFDRWKDTVETRDDVLGGEPTFRGTRLAVRHVGRMVINGVPAEEIQDDYPYLKPADIDFARLFALAYPPRGRPRREATAG